ncbi:hypothetical protein M407DRAFT_24003 [Tulasnella calospora MUT 4182]|uniref:DUF6533 domain-containing protein n=1 Tax=Tulasnella calospora MUT 4182 TaxID=1051891 RepID=A0A0C3QK46_9AGAM|nr:hypothetical protein M407DRAFT_24003 [Tulasnella calospora MUT 4182]
MLDLLMVGFTVLVWDHLCTIDEEIQFWWTAPPSAVKFLFLVVRGNLNSRGTPPG